MYRGEIPDSNRPIVGYNECVTRSIIGTYDNSKMPDIFHPLLALIASATDKELARYVEFLKEENKILRTRIKGQVHTKPEERKRLLTIGKPLGKATFFKLWLKALPKTRLCKALDRVKLSMLRLKSSQNVRLRR